MKVYTGGGDRGKTSLFSGERVVKNHRRIDAFGTVDELNSTLGALAAALPAGTGAECVEELHRVQSNLFHIGARLATLPDSPLVASIREVHPADSHFLEQAIDRIDAGLPALRAFILPGGHPAAGWAHVARTVCRRAERKVVRLAVEDAAESLERLEGVVVFLNRLSDYLFVLARHCNRVAGVADVGWTK